MTRNDAGGPPCLYTMEKDDLIGSVGSDSDKSEGNRGIETSNQYHLLMILHPSILGRHTCLLPRPFPLLLVYKIPDMVTLLRTE